MITFTGLLLHFKSCFVPCMFTVVCLLQKIRAEKSAAEGQQGAAIEFTVPPGRISCYLNQKQINIVQDQFWNFGRRFPIVAGKD
jgi:hypothetical protein